MKKLNRTAAVGLVALSMSTLGVTTAASADDNPCQRPALELLNSLEDCAAYVVVQATPSDPVPAGTGCASTTIPGAVGPVPVPATTLLVCAVRTRTGDDLDGFAGVATAAGPAANVGIQCRSDNGASQPAVGGGPGAAPAYGLIGGERTLTCKATAIVPGGSGTVSVTVRP